MKIIRIGLIKVHEEFLQVHDRVLKLTQLNPAILLCVIKSVVNNDIL